jgi:phosphoribosylaminoimidazolecarboxamide formyltransferase/IMP cyclohydrolase
VIASNRPIDANAAAEINKIFFEVIISPSYDNEALGILTQKKNRIILTIRKMPSVSHTLRSVLDGVLWQEKDSYDSPDAGLHCVTTRHPSDEEMADLDFANRIVMYTKSNAIVLVRNLQLIGFGAGQTSRVDAVRQAIVKAETFGFDTSGAVLASDAYFPFSDNVSVAAAAGIRAIIQPGGSVRDQESVDECNKNEIAMVFTGRRHFRH